MSGRHVFFDATRATCHVAYVAWEIAAFGRVGGEAEESGSICSMGKSGPLGGSAVNPKSQVAYAAWEIGAFGRVGGEAEKRQVAYVAWEIAAVKPKSQVAYVAWEIWAFGGGSAVNPKSQVAFVAWEIGAFGRVAVNPAYVAWKVGTFGGVGGKSEKSGSICSMWEGRGEAQISWGMELRRLGWLYVYLYLFYSII